MITFLTHQTEVGAFLLGICNFWCFQSQRLRVSELLKESTQRLEICVLGHRLVKNWCNDPIYLERRWSETTSFSATEQEGKEAVWWLSGSEQQPYSKE